MNKEIREVLKNAVDEIWHHYKTEDEADFCNYMIERWGIKDEVQG